MLAPNLGQQGIDLGADTLNVLGALQVHIGTGHRHRVNEPWVHAQEFGKLQRAFDVYLKRRRVVELDKTIRFLTYFAAIALGHDGLSWSPQAVETLASGLIAALDTRISDFEQINVPVINEVVTASSRFLEKPL